MLLSHVHAPNKVALADRHGKLAKLFPKIKIPTAAEEKNDSKGSFDSYTACCDKLRGMVRAEKDKFPLVHRENINYGFRRNLWGIKSWGIVVAAIAIGVVAAEMASSVIAHEQVHLVKPIVTSVNLLMLLAWIFIVTRDWVKRAAVLYAERLLEALDVLV